MPTVGSIRNALLVAVALLAGCGAGAACGPFISDATPPGAPAASGAPVATRSGRPAASARQPLNPTVKLQVAYINSSSEAALFVAAERGYFKDEGLDVELTEMRQASDQVLALTTGQIDVGDSGTSPLLFNAMERGVDLRIAGYYGVVSPTGAGLAVVIRSDLMGSGRVKEPRDLKGLTVGLNDTTGGHFAAMEVPDLLVSDVRTFFPAFADDSAQRQKRRDVPSTRYVGVGGASVWG